MMPFLDQIMTALSQQKKMWTVICIRFRYFAHETGINHKKNLKCFYIHPGRLTARTWIWWFGSNDFPFPAGQYSQVNHVNRYVHAVAKTCFQKTFWESSWNTDLQLYQLKSWSTQHSSWGIDQQKLVHKSHLPSHLILLFLFFFGEFFMIFSHSNPPPKKGKVRTMDFPGWFLSREQWASVAWKGE